MKQKGRSIASKCIVCADSEKKTLAYCYVDRTLANLSNGICKIDGFYIIKT